MCLKMHLKRFLKIYLSILTVTIGMLISSNAYAVKYARVLLVGNLGSGKTSLWKSFFGESYDPNEQSSDSMIRKDYTATVDGDSVQFNIWDTAGVASYYSEVITFTTGANFVFIVHDLSAPYSPYNEEYLGRLYRDVHSKIKSDGKIVLVGTKYDKRHDDIVNASKQRQLLENVAKTIPCPCVLTEAPNGKDPKIDSLLAFLVDKSRGMSLYTENPDSGLLKRFTVPTGGWFSCILL